MKVKYSSEVEPLRKERKGVTYFRPSGLKYAARGQANDRNRNRRQVNKKGNLIAAARHWRNLPPEDKAAWQLFATNFPQPCKYAPSGFLSGYQIFIKRQQYCFLNYGLSNEFLQAPLQRELLPVNVDFAISGVGQVIDVTENYIANFGILPSPGQKLFFKCFPMATDSGQFFPVIEQVLTVDEVYMDGLFVSLSIAPHSVPVVWSVYLSKPISNGRRYAGTKTRYMGCFTSKTFLQLLDTPSSYAGQAGKTVKVKADETGLEFGDAGGDGLTCETLPACPKIISIDTAIANIQNAIVTQNFVAIPALKYGLLYNLPAVLDSRGLAAAGWRVMLEADWRTFEIASGYPANNAGLIHITTQRAAPDPYWSATIAASTNSSRMSFTGGGQRTAAGVFQNLRVESYNWVGERYWIGSENSYYRAVSAQIYGYNVLLNLKTGMNCRLRKITTSLVNGQVGTYHGNDGKVYPTICWNNIEYLAAPLAETIFADGTIIPFAGANGVNFTNAEWAALTTPGVCPFNNDWNLV